MHRVNETLSGSCVNREPGSSDPHQFHGQGSAQDRSRDRANQDVVLQAKRITKQMMTHDCAKTSGEKKPGAKEETHTQGCQRARRQVDLRLNVQILLFHHYCYPSLIISRHDIGLPPFTQHFLVH
jgi:hypothetical protein